MTDLFFAIILLALGFAILYEGACTLRDDYRRWRRRP